MPEEVLSQAEIDKLLSAISTGVVSADEVKAEKQKKIKVYDFKRPDKFSKDQIRTLFMLHENFARLLNTYLSTNLRVLANVEVASVDQLTYEEFIRSLPNPSVISILSLSSLKGNIIFEMDTNIVFAIIDRLFGGMGDEGKMKSRTLTDIEETVMRKMMGKMMEGELPAAAGPRRRRAGRRRGHAAARDRALARPVQYHRLQPERPLPRRVG